MYNVEETAEKLAVSQRTVRTLIKQNKISYVKVGNSIRFTEKQIAEFIDNNTKEKIL